MVLNGLLWGLITVADAEAVSALYQRGYGSFRVIVFWVLIPALMFVISIGISLWLNAKGRKQMAARVAGWCLFLWLVYFLMQVPFRAI
jgi:uncharacterized PurR-regulated membrane protein YhhQ (DUF165 family)